jgi:hypothetical protein
MSAMSASYDLWYDATAVGADLTTRVSISHGPRTNDATFDPQPGDTVTVGDDEEPPLTARVFRRAGDTVWVQLQLPARSAAVE